MRIGARHSIVPWLVKHAAVLLNRSKVGRDGCTAFERSQDETIAHRVLNLAKRYCGSASQSVERLRSSAVSGTGGISLGIRGGLGEIVVADPRGAWRTRTVQPKPYEDGSVGTLG